MATAASIATGARLDLRHRECLTRDHLIPLSRGGDNEWSNVVTACSSCNTRKGNHLPEECGMHPLSAPREPHFVHLSWAVRRLSVTQAKYIKLFYGDQALRALGGTVSQVYRTTNRALRASSLKTGQSGKTKQEPRRPTAHRIAEPLRFPEPRLPDRPPESAPAHRDRNPRAWRPVARRHSNSHLPRPVER